MRYPWLLLLCLFQAAIPVWADVDGADPRLTGAPGDSVCTQCHTGTALNGGGGSVQILLPAGNTYAPGVTQHLRVQVSDPAQQRWGFELSARLASNLSGGQAGTLASTDSNTHVICENGRAAPCSSSSPVQFITHTLTGTRNGTTGSTIFEFDWTPPASDAGGITLYAAGNAANGNGQNTGDHIYTTSVSLLPAVRPVITSGGVVNGASFQPGIAANTWVTITGSNLAGTTRAWSASDIVDGNLPASLDGVSVTIDGKAAYVQYISPAQLNVIAPAGEALGPVQVTVTNNGQTSDPVTANLETFSPAFFTFDGKYLAAVHADGTLAGAPGLFASAPSATTPAKPGETIVLYGTGFGATIPGIPAGRLTDTVAPAAAEVTVTIAGAPATVLFGGLIPGFAELYQFNVQIPSDAADGDLAVIARVEGATSPSGTACCFVTVQR